MPRKKTAGVRTVIFLTEENALSVFGALTPAGEQRPPFGAMSHFFNELVERWRIARAQKENESV